MHELHSSTSRTRFFLHTRQLRAFPLLTALGLAACAPGGGDGAPGARVSEPGTLQASASSREVQLTWMDRSSDEDGFRVERRASGALRFEPLAELGADQTGFADDSVEPSRDFDYRVLAHRGGADSEPSNVVSVRTRTAAPASVRAVLAGEEVHLKWIDESDDEDGFRIERATQGVAGYRAIGTVAADVEGFVDRDAPMGSRIEYRVFAHAGGRDSASSNRVEVVTPGGLEPPQGLAVTAVAPDVVELTWTNRQPSATRIEVERASFDGLFELIRVLPAAAVEYVDLGRSEGTWYRYRLRAVAHTGASPYSAEVEVLTASGVPAQITTHLPSVSNDGSYQLSWVASGIPGASYTIEESVDSSFADPRRLILEYAGGPGHYDFVGQPPGTYWYRVSVTGTLAPSEPRAIAVVGDKPATSTVFAAADNLLLFDTASPEQAGRVHASGSLAVGTDHYRAGASLSDHVVAASALSFDLSELAGRRVRRAVLRLYPSRVPSDPGTSYSASAFRGWWGPDSITLANQPGAHVAGRAVASSPASTDEPVEWDVTAIVESWLSGRWDNHGFLIYDDHLHQPLGTRLGITGFESLESHGSADRRPQLVLELDGDEGRDPRGRRVGHVDPRQATGRRNDPVRPLGFPETRLVDQAPRAAHAGSRTR